MRNLITRPLPILAILLPFTTAVTLSEIQQINGFSPACENAYNTPLSGCTATDFSSGVCSGTCIAFLDALTQIINAECTGTSAEPDTLMGSFFQNQGTGVLCPNTSGGSNPGQSSGGSYSSTIAIGAVLYASAETTVPSTTVPSTTVPTTTSIAITTTFTPSSTVQVTSILSASGAATTTSDIIAITTVTPNAPSSMSTIKTSDVKQSSTSTSSASTSASSSSGSGSGGNGGGTILDVGSSSACRNANMKDWVLFLLAGSAGLALLL